MNSPLHLPHLHREEVAHRLPIREALAHIHLLLRNNHSQEEMNNKEMMLKRIQKATILTMGITFLMSTLMARNKLN
jgi:hypothetical protein